MREPLSMAFFMILYMSLGASLISKNSVTPLSFSFEKEMATQSSILAWRIAGMGEPGGLLSMGSHRVGLD